MNAVDLSCFAFGDKDYVIRMRMQESCYTECE